MKTEVPIELAHRTFLPRLGRQCATVWFRPASAHWLVGIAAAHRRRVSLKETRLAGIPKHQTFTLSSIQTGAEGSQEQLVTNHPRIPSGKEFAGVLFL